MKIIALCLAALLSVGTLAAKEVDICIYGGTSAGVIAAYTAKKMGKSVLLVEPGKRLGGLSSGGLGKTDIGNKYAITGLSRDFYRRVGQYYGKFEQWNFEPKVAEAIFLDYVRRGGIEVLYDARLHGVKTAKGAIAEITLERSSDPRPANNTVVRAKVFLDCTYEGDLMARAGVSYHIGREANAQYSETINGVQLMHGHQFPDGVDPYKVPGRPESGLLWGISDATLAPNGTGDKLVQAYNYRICLTNDRDNMIPITEPEGYDPSRYELLIRLIEAQPKKRKPGDYFIWSRMPNNKTDINNRGGFSTDMIGTNYNYPEAGYAERERIIREHEVYTKGLLYFWITDPRIPAELSREIRKWGYPKDEYVEYGHWTPQLYIREARRMVGEYVMTESNCVGKEVVPDGVGMAAYTMDSHNCQRIVVNGQVKNEGNVEVGGFGPYPIAYRSLTPKRGECSNLLVPVCLSSSHIAFGSIRMEPVFMVLGQSAAVAASMAIDRKSSVQDVDVAKLQKELRDNPLADGSVFESLVDNEDSAFVEVSGDWETVKQRGTYGPTTLVTRKGSGSVKFSPEVPRKGKYDVYFYLTRIDKNARTFPVVVDNGAKATEIAVDLDQLAAAGGRSGEWFLLGSFDLPAGKKASVTIKADNAQGAVPADAVVIVPSK